MAYNCVNLIYLILLLVFAWQIDASREACCLPSADFSAGGQKSKRHYGGSGADEEGQKYGGGGDGGGSDEQGRERRGGGAALAAAGEEAGSHLNGKTWPAWGRSSFAGWPAYLRVAIPSLAMMCADWW